MKAALVVLTVVAVVAVCDAMRRTTTETPCPNHCNLEYGPVCVQDPHGVVFKFDNPCLLRVCECRTNIKFAKVDDPYKCLQSARNKCPDQPLYSSTEGYGDSMEGPGAQSDSSDDASRRDVVDSY